MLGFAFSEAQRSQELMRRLHQAKGTSPPGGANTFTGGDAKQGGNGHKRTRRRRRVKKLHHGGSSSIGSRTATTAASTIAAQSGFCVPSSNNQTKNHLHNGMRTATAMAQVGATAMSRKQHDAPMTRRDLYFALRCGIVQTGPRATDTAVGRVTLLNWDNEIVVDTFVKVQAPIIDYRSELTGITPDLLESGAKLDSVRKKVGSLIRGKILIGHGLEVDLAALRLSHPNCDMRDTATYPPFMQQLDPTRPMLLPRTLDDLTQHTLQQPVLAGQSVLVSEAIACLSLYKTVRGQWERELALLMQQRERQRELVLKMRSPPTLTGEPPSLSRIAEDASGDDVGHHVDFNMRDLNREYESSTLATDRTALDNNDLYRDDISETSSFVTNDMEMDLNPLFENLQLLPEFNQSASGCSLHQTIGCSTAAGSQLEDWTISEGSLGRSSHSGIWTPLPSSNAVDSVTSEGWSHDSPQAMAHSHIPLDGSANLDADLSAIGQTPPVSLTEEELREHLPAHLLADLDVSSPPDTKPIPPPGFKANPHKEEPEEPKKKPWFSFGRRSRSMSASSTGEAAFAEIKGGSKQSLSDRLP